jgi:uracil-DNA glycosylase
MGLRLKSQMANGMEEYWLKRLGRLEDELPSWTSAVGRLPPAYRSWLANQMGTVAVTAPVPQVVFRPLAELEPGRVRVVILGQDPYPDPAAACGRAFAISAGRKVPVSLRNILKVRPADSAPPDPTLQRWVDQGVLLINASPVLYEGSGAARQPWRFFTATVLRYLAETQRPVFVFMGRIAQTYMADLPEGARTVTCPHPAARGGQFQQATLFSDINAAVGSPSISW